MNVIIIEDEYIARESLKLILSNIDSTINVVAELESITQAISLFRKNIDVDLIFLDIELSDGNSFEIFNHVRIDTPIVFATAYTEFAIKAFELNSIDYLLKPITSIGVEKAIRKFKNNRIEKKSIDNDAVKQLLASIAPPKKYKNSFLIEQGNHLIPIKSTDIAYFFIENGIVRTITKDNKSHHLNDKLDYIESQLNPELFFRVNRQFIINRDAVLKISIYFNGKLILYVQPASKEKIVVSKAKAPLLKNWLRES